MAEKLTREQIDIYRRFRRHLTLYLDTVVYGELYERFRNKSIDMLLTFIEKFDLTIVSSSAVEAELSDIPDDLLFGRIMRQYLMIYERKQYITTYDKGLIEDMVKEFGKDRESDLTHLTIAISNNVDLFTSFNKDFIIRNRKKILRLAQRHGYKKIPRIIDTDELINEISKFYE